MPPPTAKPTRTTLATVLILSAFVGGVVLLYALQSTAAATNAGTVKVHDGTDLGDTSDDPHVPCTFYIEGFGMEAESGNITIQDWPPTGNQTTVLVSSWIEANDEATADNHFLSGPYSLPSGQRSSRPTLLEKTK